jgi:hypothetical protein
MRDNIHCASCGQSWAEHDLDSIHDYWGRVEPGGVVPQGQCPNATCQALCYPPYGYVHDLEQQCTALHDVVSRLLDWAAMMGVGRRRSGRRPVTCWPVHVTRCPSLTAKSRCCQTMMMPPHEVAVSPHPARRRLSSWPFFMSGCEVGNCLRQGKW